MLDTKSGSSWGYFSVNYLYLQFCFILMQKSTIVNKKSPLFMGIETPLNLLDLTWNQEGAV
jgi:hypothetical protein